jgi:hypothetical protein
MISNKFLAQFPSCDNKKSNFPKLYLFTSQRFTLSNVTLPGGGAGTASELLRQEIFSASQFCSLCERGARGSVGG